MLREGVGVRLLPAVRQVPVKKRLDDPTHAPQCWPSQRLGARALELDTIR